MIISIILLILAYSIIGKPVGKLVNKVKDVNWCELASSTWASIRQCGIKTGKASCAPLLYFHYVMMDKNTSVTEKALVYGAILYVISPFDLLPRRILGLLGILDDISVVAFVYKKIQEKITPEIEYAVNKTLDEWFNPIPQVSI